MYYNTCPSCGANLDPGEKCDCTADKIRAKVKSAGVACESQETELALPIKIRKAPTKRSAGRSRKK